MDTKGIFLLIISLLIKLEIALSQCSYGYVMSSSSGQCVGK